MLFEEVWALITRPRPSKEFPRTPEEAADALFEALLPETREALAATRLEDLPAYDQLLDGFSKAILGLDGRNKELLNACGVSQPDEALSLIVRMVWLKIRNRNDLN